MCAVHIRVCSAQVSANVPVLVYHICVPSHMWAGLVTASAASSCDWSHDPTPRCICAPQCGHVPGVPPHSPAAHGEAVLEAVLPCLCH